MLLARWSSLEPAATLPSKARFTSCDQLVTGLARNSRYRPAPETALMFTLTVREPDACAGTRTTSPVVLALAAHALELEHDVPNRLPVQVTNMSKFTVDPKS